MRSTPVVWRVIRNMSLSENGVGIFQKEPSLLSKMLVYLGKLVKDFKFLCVLFFCIEGRDNDEVISLGY